MASFINPVLAISWLSIFCLLYINIEMLLTDTPNEVHIVYQNIDYKYENKNLENKLKVGTNKSNLEHNNLDKGGIVEILDNISDRLSHHALLFKSNSSKDLKGLTSEKEISRTNNNPKAIVQKDPSPIFRQEAIVSRNSPSKKVQQNLGSLKEMPLLETLGEVVGGEGAQGSTSKLVNEVLNLHSSTEIDTKLLFNGLMKKGIHEEVEPPGSKLNPREEVIESLNSQQPNKLTYKEQDVDGCNCMRRLPVKREHGYIILRRKDTKGDILTRTIPQLSTCSNTATLRGPKQKVVSYTYFGDISNPGIKERYFSEIKSRAEDVAKLYPGWVMRVYHNISVSSTQGQQQLCEVACQQPHVDLCSIFNLPSPWGDTSHSLETGLLWRFLPALDPLVNIMLSRDLDSHILKREVAAVTEWLSSSRLYHVMRDHPFQHTPMPAGLWGVHLSLDRAEAYHSMATLLSQVTNHDCDYDRFLLKKLLWPTVQKNVLVHDSYYCEFPEMSGQYPSVAFPTQRDGLNYTGFGNTKIYVTKHLKPCPLSCRPNDHKDWELC